MFGRAVRPDIDVPDDVVVRHGRWLTRLGGVLAGAAGPAAAVTIGRTIIVHPDVQLTERLLRHELAHVRQWQHAPVTFPLRYALEYVRRGYRDNRYEIEARAAERTVPDTEAS